MFPGSEEEGPPEDACSQAQGEASVSFHGPFNGKLVAIASGELLPAIAANMLGDDQPPTERQQLDALGEIANVICGNVLPAIAGENPVFVLSPPEVTRLTSPVEPERDEPVAATRIALDEGWADLRLYADNGTPEADSS